MEYHKYQREAYNFIIITSCPILLRKLRWSNTGNCRIIIVMTIIIIIINNIPYYVFQHVLYEYNKSMKEAYFPMMTSAKQKIKAIANIEWL